MSERTGVSVHTLRAWERRYGVPSPQRGADNRYRLYDDNDIADVRWMKQQVESGVPPAQASQLLQRHRRPNDIVATHEQPVAETQSALEAALLKSDETAASHVLDEAFAMFTPEQVALQIIQPTLLEIGDRWMRNEMAVWQEHFATNIVRQKLLAVLQAQTVPSLSVPHLITACAPMEEHELGLLMFSLFARRRGWRVTFLGQGTPLDAIADLVRRSAPSIVAVSVTTVTGLTGLIPWLEERNRPDNQLAFGGRIINAVPSLHDHLPGTFLGEDALKAVSALGTLETMKPLWSPGKHALRVVHKLEAARLKLAGEVVTQFVPRIPANFRSKWATQDLGFATLFLLDVLACALAFDAPDLVDLHRTWLTSTLIPKGVPSQLIDVHLDVVARVLTKVIDSNDARQFKLLLSRLAVN